VYFQGSMLMALHEERVRGANPRAFRRDAGSLAPGQAAGSRVRPWPARTIAALSRRSHAAARGAGLATAGARS
jgi:hypothetical protein